MLNIVVPMAGRGSRFREAGFPLPKPLIDMHGHPMIEVVIANLTPSTRHRFIFLCQREDLRAYGLEQRLRVWAPGCAVVAVDGVTEGAACTVLLARALIDSGDPLMIANSDQWVDAAVDDYLEAMDADGADGWLMTMWADHPKWSYVRFDGTGQATGVAEKQVISGHATVGIYNFRRGADFVAGADRMVAAGNRVNGEFYVAPVYDELVATGGRLGWYGVGRVGAGMHGLGIPADLEAFLASPVSQRAVGASAADRGQPGRRRTRHLPALA